MSGSVVMASSYSSSIKQIIPLINITPTVDMLVFFTKMETRIKLCDGTSSVLASFQASLGYITSSRLDWATNIQSLCFKSNNNSTVGEGAVGLN